MSMEAATSSREADCWSLPAAIYSPAAESSLMARDAVSMAPGGSWLALCTYVDLLPLSVVVSFPSDTFRVLSLLCSCVFRSMLCRRPIYSVNSLAASADSSASFLTSS